MSSIKTLSKYTLNARSSGGGGGNAVPADVANGKTFGNDVGDQVGSLVVPVANVLTGTTIAGQAGTMPEHGNVGAKSLAYQYASYTIPAGHHNGSGTVQATYVGGRQVATGTLTLGYPGTNAQATVSGLSFTPRTIMMPEVSGDITLASYTAEVMFGSATTNVGMASGAYNSNNVFSVFSGGFTVNLSNMQAMQSKQFRYVAFS